jgi:hypothetical protein
LELLIDPDLARASVNRQGVSHCAFTYDDVVDPYKEPLHRLTSLRVHDLYMERAKKAGELDIASRLDGKSWHGNIGDDFENIMRKAEVRSRLNLCAAQCDVVRRSRAASSAN